jgi:hypothetical protein
MAGLDPAIHAVGQTDLEAGTHTSISVSTNAIALRARVMVLDNG